MNKTVLLLLRAEMLPFHLFSNSGAMNSLLWEKRFYQVKILGVIKWQQAEVFVEAVNLQAFPTNTGSSDHTMRKSYLVESPLSVVLCRKLCSSSDSFLSLEPKKQQQCVKFSLPCRGRSHQVSLSFTVLPSQDPDETE